jgi:hypothetical protein
MRNVFFFAFSELKHFPALLRHADISNHHRLLWRIAELPHHYSASLPRSEVRSLSLFRLQMPDRILF